MPMTPEEVRDRAQARYGGDGYDTIDQVVFVLLVDAAEQVERDLRATLTPAAARAATLRALAAALAQREGDPHADGAAALSALSLTLSGGGTDLSAAPEDPAPMPDSFADLTDVAWTYEQDVAAERGARMIDSAGDEAGPVSLGEAGGLTPRVTMLLGLIENLDMRDDEQREAPAA